jgi:S1/P1 Nuclease
MSANKIIADDNLDLIKPDSGLYDSEFWAVSRHELIADVAEGLTKPKTRQKIAQVLKPLVDQGFAASLSDLAGWADLVKHRGPQSGDDKDTVTFLKDERNTSRGSWHFVDLPLDADEYSREKYPTLTSDEDIVQTIKESVRVLQGKSDRFSPINALRLVVHLVGDVHQPVHVGCGYLDESGGVAKIVRNPKTIIDKGLDSDRGGNKLILPIGNTGAVNLHSYWDSRLGGNAPDLNDPQAEGEADAVVTPELKKRFSNKLRQMIDQDTQSVAGEGEGEADTTSPEDWAEDWANETLAGARSAYQSIEITGANGSNFDVDWEGKEAYDKRCKPIALERMKSAARNLALLLDAIFA